MPVPGVLAVCCRYHGSSQTRGFWWLAVRGEPAGTAHVDAADLAAEEPGFVSWLKLLTDDLQRVATTA